MEEKKIVHQIVLDVWNLTKEYEFKHLSEEEWSRMIEKASELREKYRQQGENFKMLFVQMFFAVQEYYAAKEQ